MTTINKSILVSSVIRSAKRGESHGGLYVADMNNGHLEQVLDWNDDSISFHNRGAERGLRGLAFYQSHILCADCHSIQVYDRNFRLIHRLTNAYLGDCHEIFVQGNDLYAASTAYDSVLQFDLRSGACVQGWCFRHEMARKVRSVLWKVAGIKRPVKFGLRLFDPNGADGPHPADLLHLNNVNVHDGVLYVSSYRANILYAVQAGRLSRFAQIPLQTHNVRRFGSGILAVSTGEDALVLQDIDGKNKRKFPVVFPPELGPLPPLPPHEHARPGFMRGMDVYNGTLAIVGSSPAALIAYDLTHGAAVKTMLISRDVCNAVHGLRLIPNDFPW